MSVPAAMVISCVETSYLATMPTGWSTRSKIEASSFSGLLTRLISATSSSALWDMEPTSHVGPDQA